IGRTTNRILNSRSIPHSFKSTVRGARKQVPSRERPKPKKGGKPQAMLNPGNTKRPSKSDSTLMRSVLITGTSSGIGLATTVVLASRGWRVFATMRNLQKRSALEQALRAAGMQENVDIQELDVTRSESTQATTASIMARTGNTLDAVVHNAGV